MRPASRLQGCCSKFKQRLHLHPAHLVRGPATRRGGRREGGHLDRPTDDGGPIRVTEPTHCAGLEPWTTWGHYCPGKARFLLPGRQPEKVDPVLA